MMITFLIFSSLSASSQVPSLLNLASDTSFENIEQKNSGWYPVGIVVEERERPVELTHTDTVLPHNIRMLYVMSIW